MVVDFTVHFVVFFLSATVKELLQVALLSQRRREKREITKDVPFWRYKKLI